MSEQTNPTESSSSEQSELERVREIIVGPEKKPKVRKTEADRLREIIFGPQSQEYERRFANLQRDIERAQSDIQSIREQSLEIDARQNRQLETLERNVRQSYDEIRREIDQIRSQETTIQQLSAQQRQHEVVVQKINKTNNELSSTQGQHGRDLQALREAVNDIRGQHERKIDTLRREFRTAEDNLWSELRRTMDRLGGQKADRKSLAAMFTEIATRLETGGNVTGLLDDLDLGTEE